MDVELSKVLVTSGFAFLGVLVTTYGTLYSKSKKHQEYIDSFPPLEEHVMFCNLNEYIRKSEYIDVRHVCDGRRLIAIDFLQMSIKSWEKPCMAFAKDMTLCCSSCKSSCNSCNKIYLYATKMFENASRYDYNINNISPSDREAFEIFLNKFKEWNQERLERLYLKIHNVSLNNDTYKTCGMKSARILEAVDDHLFDMITDAMLTVMKLNGELKGKKYIGHTL